MIERLDRLYLALARVELVVLLSNAVIVFFIVFGLVGAEIPDGAPGVIDLQLAFSADRFSEITAQWGPDVVATFRARLWIDYLFPPVYALALASAVAWFTARGKDSPPYLVLALFVLPFVAMLADWIENTAHYIALDDPANPPGALVLIASVAAVIKWALIGVVLAVVVVQFLVMTGRYLVRQRV